MTNDTIKISKDYGGLWLGQEVSVAHGEDKMEAWRKAEREMNQYFQSRSENTMHDFNTGIPSSPPVINRGEIDKLEIAIDNAATVNDLMNLREDVIKYDDPAKNYPLMEQWNNKYKELFKQ